MGPKGDRIFSNFSWCLSELGYIIMKIAWRNRFTIAGEII